MNVHGKEEEETSELTDIEFKLFNMLKNYSTKIPTYTLAKIIKILDLYPEKLSYRMVTRASCSIHPDGCVIDIKGTEWHISAQTAPMITGDALCETALMYSEKGLIYAEVLGYEDVIRHYSSKEFHSHINELLSKLEGKKLEDFTVRKSFEKKDKPQSE